MLRTVWEGERGSVGEKHVFAAEWRGAALAAKEVRWCAGSPCELWASHAGCRLAGCQGPQSLARALELLLAKQLLPEGCEHRHRHRGGELRIVVAVEAQDELQGWGGRGGAGVWSRLGSAKRRGPQPAAGMQVHGRAGCQAGGCCTACGVVCNSNRIQRPHHR